MKKVLVTGASGFIGNSISEYFIQKGFNVFGWDILKSESSIKTKIVDMLDEETIIRELDCVRPDIIIHCAGSADVWKSIENPRLDFEGNVKITHNLLFAMHKLKIEEIRFVFLSSAGVYGNPHSLPITEDFPLFPLSPYALHKVMCEEICMYFISNYGMNIKIGRIFSAYGAGLKKQIFWDMYNKYYRTGKLEMFGTGEESRDYIHVVDVVRALYLLATTQSSEIFFNIANGEEITIREATEMFADSLGVSRNIIQFNGVVREGDPLNWKADISRLRKIGYNKSINMTNALDDYTKWVYDVYHNTKGGEIL